MKNDAKKITIALIDLNAGIPNMGIPSIEEALRNAELSWHRFEPRVTGSIPTEAYEGVIISGGPGSPLEDRPWRKELLRWISQLPNHTPILGICMGCQLLAYHHGWSLQKLRSPRFGLYPLSLTKTGRADPIFRDLPTEARVFEQRRWGIYSDRGSARGSLLASTRDGDAIAIRFGEHSVGTIFHPEAAPVAVRSWLENDVAARNKINERHGPNGHENQLSRCPDLTATFQMVIPRFLGTLRSMSSK